MVPERVSLEAITDKPVGQNALARAQRMKVIIDHLTHAQRAFMDCEVPPDKDAQTLHSDLGHVIGLALVRAESRLDYERKKLS